MPHPKGGYMLNGEKIPGVTTINKRFQESGGLLYWACEQGKAIQRGEISALYDKRDEAAEAGTLAHALVEAHIKGIALPTLPEGEVEQLAKQGFENYLKWESGSRIKVVAQELELVSEVYRFGGCPDAIGQEPDGYYCLLDWKTSDKVYPDHLIQMAAYFQLLKESEKYRHITEQFSGFHLCRFSKHHADFAHHFYSELDDAWQQFKLFRQAYEIDKKLKKRV